MTHSGDAAPATLTANPHSTADRRAQIDQVQARIEGRFRAMRLDASADVLAALAHDVLNDAIQIALDWIEPAPVGEAEPRTTPGRTAPLRVSAFTTPSFGATRYTR